VSDRGPLTDEEWRKRIRNGIRAMGRPLSAEATRLHDEFVGLSERISKAAAHRLSDEAKLAVTLTHKSLEIQRTIDARDRQKKSASRKHKNHAERDCWIREQYAKRKNRHRGYSFAQFRRELKARVIRIPAGLRGSFRRDGRFVSEERLRQIVKNA
jgi:hypothetical protein